MRIKSFEVGCTASIFHSSAPDSVVGRLWVAFLVAAGDAGDAVFLLFSVCFSTFL